MMYKRRGRPVIALILLCILLWPAVPACADVDRLIVLTAGDGSSAAEAELRSIALYNNWQCDFADARTEVNLDGYTGAIICVDEDAQLNEQTLSGLQAANLPVFIIGSAAVGRLADVQTVAGSIVIGLESESGQINELLVYGNSLTLLTGEGTELGGDIYVVGKERYPLCKTVGNITQMAYFDVQYEGLCAQLATLLQQWLWPYRNAPTSYGQYLVLDNVYPFTDPERLMEISDMLESENVAYAICAMPLYSNAEYPAMKRFCEYLRYVQSRGCSIVLHVPLITLENVEADEVKNYIDMAFSGYVQYGIYPVALEAPETWLQSEKGLSVLEGTRTVLLFESDEVISDAPSGNIAVADGHQLIAPAYSGYNAFTSSYAQAIYLDVTQDVETLRTQVQRLKNSRRVLKNLSDMENILYSGDHYVRANTEYGYFYDDKYVSTAYEPFVYEDYKYDRGFTQYLTEQIQTSNKLILGFVFVACGFFIAAIILSRRQMRRELLRGGGKKRHGANAKEEGAK